jgi:coenzyme F420-reducing hydrogenase beta subunit
MIDRAIKKDKDCSGCFACVNICPVNCITMETDAEGFKYPLVDYDKCKECGKCIKACPIINKKELKREIRAYACINKNEAIRKESSSGGVFTLIAESIIEQGGVVFGAAFDDNFALKHSYVETKKDLAKFRGSKYLQSEVGMTFKKAKEFLENERAVFFTGTPCQIAGLKSYLGKDYANLFCADIVCHGVPSPEVFKEYLDFSEKKLKTKIKKISFRDKSRGWHSFSFLMKLENKKEYCESSSENLYLKAFLNNVCLRPSCYNCNFKGLNRASDITLADFWGIEKILPKMDDNKGVSLIFVNSLEGKNKMNKLKSKLICEEVELDKALKRNISAVRSAKLKSKRRKFMKDFKKLSFDELVKKHCKEKRSRIIRKKAKKLVLESLVKFGLIKAKKVKKIK